MNQIHDTFPYLMVRDAMGERAVATGAQMLMPPADQFYGERSCRLRDPFGHTWLLGHSIEKVDPEEMQRR